jgi:hypothetical protein
MHLDEGLLAILHLVISAENRPYNGQKLQQQQQKTTTTTTAATTTTTTKKKKIEKGK